MKIKYEIFDESSYRGYCAMLEDLFPNDMPPSTEEYTEVGTGEVVTFIKGGIFSEDKFLIADDKTGKFLKVKISDCKKIID